MKNRGLIQSNLNHEINRMLLVSLKLFNFFPFSLVKLDFHPILFIHAEIYLKYLINCDFFVFSLIYFRIENLLK